MENLDSNSPGMSEDKLLELCSSNPSSIFKIFWTSEVYGFGKYIKKYGYYPSFLPLAIYNEHGVGSINDRPFEHELKSFAPVMFYHSPEAVRIWHKFSQKSCYVLYSPFVFYRRKNNIIQNKNAKGTIIFPNHTIPSMDEVSDTQLYINQLKQLPKKFQPISVCLHYHDILIGRHKIYLKNNIPTYSAGNDFNFFIERFYDILKKFKYSSSNQASSSLFYAVEMGIPFFVYGNKSENINKNDPNYVKGRLTDYEEYDSYKKLDKMFSGFNFEITTEKKKFVETNLGIYDGISRKKMAYILYISFLKLFFIKEFYKKLLWYLIKKWRGLTNGTSK